MPSGWISRFYQPDATTAMSPAPTDVKVTLSGTVIPLAPQPGERGRFASAPGNYPDDLRGQIELVLDGKTLEAKFSFRSSGRVTASVHGTRNDVR
jgi:hypothetical protein